MILPEWFGWAWIRFSVFLFSASSTMGGLAAQEGSAEVYIQGNHWRETDVVAIRKLLADLPQPVAPQSPLYLYLNPSRQLEVGREPGGETQSQAEHYQAVNPDDKKSPASQLLHYLLHQYERRHNVSQSRQWRRISDWNRGYLGLWLEAGNQDPRAFSQPGAMNDPEEDFVSSAEYFILPPNSLREESLKCRTPRKYAFLKAHFPSFQSPFERLSVSCKTMDHGLLDDVRFMDPDTGRVIDMGEVNRDTVTGFELLYATPGTGDASEIAGHLLLRIKLNNNPRAQQLGVENPHDLLISFLANTSDFHQLEEAESESETPVPRMCERNWLNLVDDGRSDFNAWHSIVQSLKGLAGGFLTMMDRQTLGQAIKNYTVEEDRSLLRYRLNLSDEQKYNLLARIYQAKKNYKAKYYFFSQNCASVLVKIIGEGIGDSEIAEFSPLVSAPNSLLGLFIRKGLAEPVYPVFAGFRRRAHQAQSQFEHDYIALNAMIERQVRNNRQSLQQAPPGQWPPATGFFSDDEQQRLQAVRELRNQAKNYPEFDGKFYQLAQLIQESEQVYAYKAAVCENYTSPVTAEVRLWQQALLQANADTGAKARMDLIKISDRQLSERERKAWAQGNSHTRLIPFTVGAGYRHTKNQGNHSESVLLFDGSLERQEMGSRSNIAMQRGGAVELASVELSVAPESEHPLKYWQVTTLQVRKFKEKLNTVPTYFSESGEFGLGLSFLDISAQVDHDYLHGTIAGGELLFNLYASDLNNDYAFFGLGADIHRHIDHGHSETAVVFPLYLETLMSMGEQRRWQWRNAIEYRVFTTTQLHDESELNTELSYQLPDSASPAMLLKLSANHQQIHVSNGEDLSSWQTWLGLEFNYW